MLRTQKVCLFEVIMIKPNGVMDEELKPKRPHQKKLSTLDETQKVEAPWYNGLKSQRPVLLVNKRQVKQDQRTLWSLSASKTHKTQEAKMYNC